VWNNDTAEVEAILKANPDLDVGSEDHAHFFIAISHNCLEIFKLLMDHPATDLNKRDSFIHKIRVDYLLSIGHALLAKWKI